MKCCVCGRFIGYDDLDSGAASSEYTPISEFTKETIEFICKSCNQKEIAK